jgi:hypothetical protein
LATGIDEGFGAFLRTRKAWLETGRGWESTALLLENEKGGAVLQGRGEKVGFFCSLVV